MRFPALLICAVVLLCGCQSEVESKLVTGFHGSAGKHSAITKQSQGNPFGYYEYVPLLDSHTQPPIIFYWNGANAIKGNGTSEIDRLLSQGLPQFINEGKHYAAIILSAMLSDWQTQDVSPFVEYALTRYQGLYDPNRIYMTGFSAGGGVTLRYFKDHPEKLAAIIPIAPAAHPPKEDELTPDHGQVASWFFHNSGDMKVEIWRSNQWHHALKSVGGERRITRPDLDSHYAWQAAYNSQDTWNWLFAQSKNEP